MIEKKIGRFIGIGMGLTMSMVMSIVGSVMGVMDARAKAGEANLPPFVVMLLPSLLVSLLVASVLSIGLGLIIPMNKISGGLGKATRAKGMELRIMQAFVSDLLYTPAISLIMSFVSAIFFAKVPAKAVFPVALKSFVRSFPIEFVLALIAIIIVEPIIKKAAVKKYAPGGLKESGETK